MNDTNREAEIRERVRVEREPWPFDGHEQPAMDRALVLDDIAYLLSALDSEREARRELEKAARDAVVALDDLGACNDADCSEVNCLRALPRLRALLTTEDSNKTTAVHTERNE